MSYILHNLAQIKDRISNACLHAGRNPDEVKLLLATKTVPVENIRLVLNAGETLIGENKVQEIKEKYEGLKDISHEKHFIGYLQSNKIKDILKYEVSCIQSIDRIDLAEKLHHRLDQDRRKMDILIQVNTSAEVSKFGVSPDEAIDLVKQISQYDTLNIKGLMTIGLFSSEVGKVRKCFKILKTLQQKIISQNIPNVEMNELSMGMSGDLEIAIEEGATIIRVGTAIFGQRVHPDSYYWDENKA